MSYLEKCAFSSFPIFLKSVFCLVLDCLNILDVNCLLDSWFISMFPDSLCGPFTLMMVSFAAKIRHISMQHCLAISASFPCAFGVMS